MHNYQSMQQARSGTCPQRPPPFGGPNLQSHRTTSIFPQHLPPRAQKKNTSAPRFSMHFPNLFGPLSVRCPVPLVLLLPRSPCRCLAVSPLISGRPACPPSPESPTGAKTVSKNCISVSVVNMWLHIIFICIVLFRSGWRHPSCGARPKSPSLLALIAV